MSAVKLHDAAHFYSSSTNKPNSMKAKWQITQLSKVAIRQLNLCWLPGDMSKKQNKIPCSTSEVFITSVQTSREQFFWMVPLPLVSLKVLKNNMKAIQRVPLLWDNLLLSAQESRTRSSLSSYKAARLQRRCAAVPPFYAHPTLHLCA